MKGMILASRNDGKLREFNHAFESSGIVFAGLETIPDAPEVEETGKTYADNAMLKARAIAIHTGKPVVAEDSGIEIDAMPGRLGVYSARYADGRPYSEVNAGILKQLEGGNNRSCRYRCSIAMYDPGTKEEHTVEGTCAGVIHDRQEGDGGFGYDPIFYIPEYGRTMAQLPLSIKNTISHRARAIQKLKEVLCG